MWAMQEGGGCQTSTHLIDWCKKSLEVCVLVCYLLLFVSMCMVSMVYILCSIKILCERCVC